LLVGYADDRRRDSNGPEHYIHARHDAEPLVHKSNGDNRLRPARRKQTAADHRSDGHQRKA
jgi:hypothetical protein